jgi:hypothetical protein
MAENWIGSSQHKYLLVFAAIVSSIIGAAVSNVDRIAPKTTVQKSRVDTIPSAKNAPSTLTPSERAKRSASFTIVMPTGQSVASGPESANQFGLTNPVLELEILTPGHPHSTYDFRVTNRSNQTLNMFSIDILACDSAGGQLCKSMAVGFSFLAPGDSKSDSLHIVDTQSMVKVWKPTIDVVRIQLPNGASEDATALFRLSAKQPVD